MKKLFDVLDAIVDSGREAECLSSADAVIGHAEAGGLVINSDQAESVVRVGKSWAEQRENGNGEWSRMRHEAEQQLTCYMHEQSGDVATAEMWHDDFKRMDVESWFGKEAADCENLHWLNDAPWLIEVEWDSEEQAWVEA